MRLAVVGTGYVGLVAGTCFAELGNEVTCADSDEKKIRALKKGWIPIYEPGLQELVTRNVEDGRLRFTTSLRRAVRNAHIIFIAVGTPPDEDGSADLTHVLNVARGVGQAMDGYKVVVTKSTVPAGTAEKVRQAIAEQTDHPAGVVSNPEFLKEGTAIEDFMRPDRVVIGTTDAQAAQLMRELYAPVTRTGAEVMVMDCVSAELSKYAANAMLATRVSFMNEMANVCERFSADVDQVRRAIAADRRIGESFLFPGIGYGGSCFPKDVKAVIKFARDAGYRCELLESVETVNKRQKSRLVEKMQGHFGTLEGKKVALWGLAFKPKTDDTREAPAIEMAKEIVRSGGKVVAYDPEASDSARAILDGTIEYAKSSYDALEGADALAIATEWSEFLEPDFSRMRSMMRTPIIFDGRNIYTPQQMRTEGFEYFSIGR
jgi:UDPglucose 6-dehydrogenase